MASLIAEHAVGDMVTSLAVCAGGTRLLTGSALGHVRVWDLGMFGAREVGTVFAHGEEPVMGVAADDAHVYATFGVNCARILDTDVEQFQQGSTVTENFCSTIKRDMGLDVCARTQVAQAGGYVAVMERSHSNLQRYDLAGGQMETFTMDEIFSMVGVLTAFNGRFLAWRSPAKTSASIGSISLDASVVFSKRGARDLPKAVFRVFDWTRLSIVHECTISGFLGFQLSPNGQYVVTAGDMELPVLVWDLDAFSVNILQGHTSPVISVTFGESHESVFSLAADGELLYWYRNDLAGRQQVPKEVMDAADATWTSLHWVSAAAADGDQNKGMLLLRSDHHVYKILGNWSQGR